MAGEHAALLARQGAHKLAAATFERVVRHAHAQQLQQLQAHPQRQEKRAARGRGADPGGYDGNEQEDGDDEVDDEAGGAAPSRRQPRLTVRLDHLLGLATSAWALVDAKAAADVCATAHDDDGTHDLRESSSGPAATAGPLGSGGAVSAYTSVHSYQEKVRAAKKKACFFSSFFPK